jgi:hypothetical protein
LNGLLHACHGSGSVALEVLPVQIPSSQPEIAIRFNPAETGIFFLSLNELVGGFESDSPRPIPSLFKSIRKLIISSDSECGILRPDSEDELKANVIRFFRCHHESPVALKRFIHYYSFESHETIVVLDADLSPQMEGGLLREAVDKLRRDWLSTPDWGYAFRRPKAIFHQRTRIDSKGIMKSDYQSL